MSSHTLHLTDSYTPTDVHSIHTRMYSQHPPLHIQTLPPWKLAANQRRRLSTLVFICKACVKTFGLFLPPFFPTPTTTANTTTTTPTVIIFGLHLFIHVILPLLLQPPLFLLLPPQLLLLMDYNKEVCGSCSKGVDIIHFFFQFWSQRHGT